LKINKVLVGALQQCATKELAEEKTLIENKIITSYKRSVKTGLFSGNFNASYLYLSLSYIIIESKQEILIVGAYTHYYPD
jgi:hypothetical protein